MVRIGLARYRGSFNTRTFGEKKPHICFCHEGQLELVYHKDPGLKAGQPVSALDDSVTVEFQQRYEKRHRNYAAARSLDWLNRDRKTPYVIRQDADKQLYQLPESGEKKASFAHLARRPRGPILA